MTGRRIVLTCAWTGALISLGAGGWALLGPHSFFDVVAHYEPYNRHLLHDIGAFQLGIGAGVLAGICGRRGLAAALWAGAVGACAHAVSHWLDADLGGRATDPVLITVLAAVLVAGLVVAERPGGGVVR